MKALIKKGILRVFDPIAFRLGYRKKDKIKEKTILQSQYQKESLLNNFYEILKAVPFYPKHIVDVGANHGTWTREALKAFPDSMFTLFEPQGWLSDSIKNLLDTNPKITFNAVGVGKEKGTFKFTIVNRDDSCNFRITETEAKEKGFKQIEVPIVTLNEFIKERKLPVPDIIKIDAEGIDLEVLEGANEYFGKTEIFMVEVGIVNKIFSNNCLAVIEYMDRHDYRLFDITDLNRQFNTKVLWLMELVFIKKHGKIDSHQWN